MVESATSPLDFVLAAAVRDLDDSTVLPALRAAARGRLARLEWPNKRVESWKYTNVAPLTATSFATATQVARGGLVESLSRGLGLSDARLVFVDGCYAAELSSVAQSGVWVGSLQQALRDGRQEIREALERAVQAADSTFATVNAALLQDGACISVPKNSRAAAPIEIVHIATSDVPRMSHVRHMVIVGDGAEATVVETFVTSGHGTHFTNATTHIVLGVNARAEHVRLQAESGLAYHVGALYADVPRDSRLRSSVISLGGALSRQDLNVSLCGAGANAALSGLAIAGGRQHVDHNVMLEHAQPHGTSSQLFKGVFAERATGVFGGKVLVRPHAVKTDARQLNKNLLLSPHAVAHTRPQLEILTDDVKCSHGATVGQLDEVALFYLRSRGLDAAVARHLLTHAFVSGVLQEVSSTAIRDALQAHVTQALEAIHGKEAP